MKVSSNKSHVSKIAPTTYAPYEARAGLLTVVRSIGSVANTLILVIYIYQQIAFSDGASTQAPGSQDNTRCYRYTNSRFSPPSASS